jgi:hypothetical protein
MGISTHPVDSTVVISLWQGDTCTGTFRMPAKDAARLISTLAYGMTEAMPGHPVSIDESQSPLGRIWANVLRRVFARSPRGTGTHLRLLK